MNHRKRTYPSEYCCFQRTAILTQHKVFLKCAHLIHQINTAILCMGNMTKVHMGGQTQSVASVKKTQGKTFP